MYGFPSAVCISVNDEAIHGIPGDRTLRTGDLVKLDLVAENGGFFADAAVTVRVGEVSTTADALVRCAESAFHHAAKAACAGNRVYDIGLPKTTDLSAWYADTALFALVSVFALSVYGLHTAVTQGPLIKDALPHKP